jgi:hypothetical protein
VAGKSACPLFSHSLQRFRDDWATRYPKPAEMPLPQLAAGSATDQRPQVRLRRLPPEMGILLLIVGTAGILLPGPVGSPFLLAGGIALWPAGFRRVEGWFMKFAPTMYETGIQQIEHFLADLERRYPGSAN